MVQTQLHCFIREAQKVFTCIKMLIRVFFVVVVILSIDTKLHLKLTYTREYFRDQFKTKLRCIKATLSVRLPFVSLILHRKYDSEL